MTHAELTAAVRASEIRPDRGCDRHNSYVLHKVVPGDQLTASAQRSVATRDHARQPEEPGRDGWAGGSSRPATCACGHETGDHHGVRRGPLHPPLLGRCLVYGCDCEIFTERVLRAVPGTGGRRHV